MLLKEIINFIDLKIPKNLALKGDNIGFVNQEIDLNQNIEEIVVLMDLTPDLDNFNNKTLVISHHPPIFSPKTTTYTVHSNWDVIEGGANDALSKVLNLEIINTFDKKLNIGRISKYDSNYLNFENKVKETFPNINIRIVNRPDDEIKINKIATISGFGLKNPNYVQLASDNNINILVSGDLTQESAILAKKLGICLIDLGHHHSEVPGLEKLSKLLSKLELPITLINKSPWEDVK